METVFNVFLPFSDGVCDHALYLAHTADFRDDTAACQYLKGQVEADLQNAQAVRLQRRFTLSEYHAHCRLGQGHHLYDEVFREAGCTSNAPLFVTTEVIDGLIQVSLSVHHNNPDFYLSPEILGDRRMDDWLLKYRRGDQLDIPQLIHDDYFVAIKLTYNAGLTASSCKLLLSCMDSLAYIEYGDTSEFTPFVRWWETFGDLSSVGVTAVELWEFRNGLLHMTNLNSRKVAKQKVRRISVRRGGQGGEEDGIYFFEFYSLIRAFQAAVETWLKSYNSDRAKFAKFVERYDETISDVRILTRSEAPSNS